MGIRPLNLPNTKEKKGRRIEVHARVANVNENVKPSIFEDAKRGEGLVNIRLLLSGKNELDQRRSLVHTMWKYKYKCSNVITDGGSTISMVLENMVTKLNLKR